jgi:competence protein ComEC
MLCIDPYLLWDIGFQLSYAAVASLLIYQKAIFRLHNPENLLLLHGWNLVSTTIAAQVLTTPLIVFHFGQFPIVFLLSNILAVPLSGLILLLLCGAALTYPLGLGSPLALLAESLIQLMNKRIQALSQLSFASISNITLSIWDVINIYILLLALTLWIRSKKR